MTVGGFILGLEVDDKSMVEHSSGVLGILKSPPLCFHVFNLLLQLHVQVPHAVGLYHLHMCLCHATLSMLIGSNSGIRAVPLLYAAASFVRKSNPNTSI